MQIFYATEMLSGEYELNETESKHCAKSLRLNVGDFVGLTDCKGNLFRCEIIDNNLKKCKLKVLEAVSSPVQKTFQSHIAVSYTKNPDRFEWFVEKATEIGIDQITPLVCDRTERQNIKTERLEKILISALKQSQQTLLPILNPPIRFDDFVQQNFRGQKFIAHCLENEKVSYLSDVYAPGKDAVILIGPEGDFTPKEISAAIEKQFSAVSLGENRLRVETAALYACTCFQVLNQIKHK